MVNHSLPPDWRQLLVLLGHLVWLKNVPTSVLHDTLACDKQSKLINNWWNSKLHFWMKLSSSMKLLNLTLNYIKVFINNLHCSLHNSRPRKGKIMLWGIFTPPTIELADSHSIQSSDDLSLIQITELPLVILVPCEQGLWGDQPKRLIQFDNLLVSAFWMNEWIFIVIIISYNEISHGFSKCS